MDFGFPGYALRCHRRRWCRSSTGSAPPIVRRSGSCGHRSPASGTTKRDDPANWHSDRSCRQAACGAARDWVLDPIGMTQSTFELHCRDCARSRPPERTIATAHGWATRGMSTRSTLRPGCGPDADDRREVPDRSAEDLGGPVNASLSRAMMLEWSRPLGSDRRGRILNREAGEGWYSAMAVATGASSAECWPIDSRLRVVIMTMATTAARSCRS